MNIVVNFISEIEFHFFYLPLNFKSDQGSMETTLFNLREEATKSRLENIREKVAMEVANACRELTDQIIGWIFHATDVEGEWFVFPQTVALLLIFSCVGSFFDLPTLCKGNSTYNIETFQNLHTCF